MSNFKFAKFASVLFVSVFVLFSYNVSLAQERVADTKTLTGIEIKNVKIEKSDTEIKISGALFNPSKNIITPGITHLLILKTIDPLIKSKSERELLPSLIVAADEGKDYFSLKPNEQKVFSYVLPFSPYIPQANYSLYLGFIRSSGEVEVSYENSAKNLGSSQKEAFLAFDQESCVLLNKEGKKFGNNDGPTLLPGESPEVHCLIKNIGGKEIQVSPKILWKEVYVYGKPLDGTMAIENLDQKIFFKPGETKLVSLFMPKAEKPQVYQSLLSFEDKDRVSRSFNMFFRWTIAGESARIKSVTQISPLKDSYAKGEKISLSADYFGSADLFWTGTGQNVSNLSRLKILAIVKDKSNEICGENDFNLPDINDSASKNKIIDVVMEKRCENASYSVSIHSGEKKLAEELGELPKIVKERNISPYLYFGLPALMILLVFAFFRKKKIVPIHLLIILFASLTMFSSLALAAETQIYPDPWGGTTSVGNWWGDWTLGSGSNKLRSNPSGGAGVSTLRIYSAEADFSDSFNTSGVGTVFLDYRATDQSCANTAMKVSVQMSVMADGLSEQYITFAKTGSTNYSTEKRFLYNNAVGGIIEKGFDIPASVIASFYDNNKKARTNPKLIIHFKQVGYQSHDDKYSKGYFTGNESAKLRTENDAFNVSDIIQIEIPLKIPSPSADLSLSGTSPIDYNCKPALNWTVNDVSSCTANGGWIGTKSAANGTHSETMASGITASTNYGLSCSKDLGSSIGVGTYADSVTVGVNAAPTVDLKVGSGSSPTSWTGENVKDTGELTVNKGDSVTVKWTGAGASYCRLIEFNQSNINTGVSSQTYNTPSVYNSKTFSNVTESKTYYVECPNASVCYYAKDTVKVKVSTGPGLSVTCSASPSSVGVGSNVTFTATATRGVTPYTYAWTGTDITSGASGTTGSTITKSYSTTGTKNATITVTDSSSPKQNSSYTCSADVTPCVSNCGGTDQCGSTNNACVSGSLSDTTDTSTQYLWSCGSASCALNKGGSNSKTLTINIISGSGTVSDKDSNVLCHGSADAPCSPRSYAEGTVFDLLSASGDSGYGFGSWGGDCTISGNNCSVTLDDNRIISASFNTNSGDYVGNPCPSCEGGGVTSSSPSSSGTGLPSSSSPSSSGTGSPPSSSSRPSVIIQEI